MYAGGSGSEAFTGEDVEEGGFACAVCADEEAAGSTGEGEREVVEGGERGGEGSGEGEGEVGDVDGCVGIGVGGGIWHFIIGEIEKYKTRSIAGRSGVGEEDMGISRVGGSGLWQR